VNRCPISHAILRAEWTDWHYQLARQLMKKIHLLPPDWDDDVIQEVAAKYSHAFQTWDGRNFNGWLYKILRNQTLDIKKKEEGRVERIRKSRKGSTPQCAR
jgi:DNA-directed RNA polymerase specialized sigma24 family protein